VVALLQQLTLGCSLVLLRVNCRDVRANARAGEVMVLLVRWKGVNWGWGFGRTEKSKTAQN
jgi:hypothetical protein